MTHELAHHDLIRVDFGRRQPGIYWLRLYKAEGAAVAILTEVPGNPGLSVTNAVSSIASFVARESNLDLRELVLYEVWPSGGPVSSHINRVSLTSTGQEVVPHVGPGKRQKVITGTRFTGSPEWGDATWVEVEALLGQPVSHLPEHEELYKRVCDLGGGVVEEVRRPVFEALPVEELPPPHNPSGCKHYVRFEELEASLDPDEFPHWIERGVEAGRRFLDTLTPEDISTCPYHKGNWQAVADESVRIVSALGRRDRDDYVAGVKASPLSGEDKSRLYLMFTEPVVVGGGSYTDGQHRGCALRFSGAERAGVVVDDEVTGEECTDWVYEGGG